MSDDRGTDVGVAEPDAPAIPPRRRRWLDLRPLTRIAIVVGCILAGVVLLDLGTRFFLQWKIAQTVEESLPEGAAGEVSADVGGFSAIWQVVDRRFDHLALSAPTLQVAGVTVDAHVDAYGVALFDGLGVEQLTGTVALSQESLNALVPIPGATDGIVLGDGEVSYATAVDFFGTSYSIDVAAVVHVQEDRLVVQATKLQLVGGPIDFDATSLLPNASTVSFPICSAEYLPVGLHLSGVDIRPGSITLSITANTIALDEATLTSRGVCR